MKYRRRASVIEAMRWNALDRHAAASIIRWVRLSGGSVQFYPCDPDVFEASYEPVEESS